MNFSSNSAFLTSQKPLTGKRRHKNTYNDQNVEKYFNKKFSFKWNEDWKLPEADRVYRDGRWSILELQEMKDELNKVKSQLDEFDLDEWSLHTKKRDVAGGVFGELKKYVKPELLTQAWCKFYEIISQFDVIPESAVKSETLNSLHLCEAPGAFISSLNHYIKLNHPEIQWNWIANSLNPEYEGNSLSQMIPNKILIHNTRDRWYFGLDNTGDITQYCNHLSILNAALKYKEIMLITADGSINCMFDPGNQEFLVEHLHFCEMVTALSILADDRVCVVDGRGGFRRAGKYCPILDKPDSKVECVIGLDRLDCLRRISKGKVDFAVFTAEDLVAAANSQVEVLITNEMRFSASQNYEYDVVAIIDDESGIKSRYDLRDKKLCHPGYGYEVDWTRILANYFEATVVPKSCDEKLTLVENRIKASSMFFKAACKAGPWVSDDLLDEKLKSKYSNLCSLCGNPGRCSTNDKYWGRRGPLYCLTDGMGDVAWARLDDVRVHFGLVPGGPASTAEGYSFLCPDGTKKPVNATVPCSWVSRPWPIVSAKRTSAQEIQRFINRLDHNDTQSWQNALLNLIESYHADIHNVNPIQDIEGYLLNVPGFLSANSFTGCHPPRSIRMCTTSNLENAKCGWLREAAAVYGLEPDFDCVKADNKSHCMEAVQFGLADVVFLSPDMLMKAERDRNLQTLLYEDVKPDDRYETVAIVKKDSKIHKFADMRGKKACFPHFEGIAWNSMLYEFHRRGLLSYECPYSLKAAKFFGDMCAPSAPKGTPGSITKLCNSNYEGDMGALKCFTLEEADVVFVSKNSLRKLLSGPTSNEKWISKLISEGTKIICENEYKPCELSWATISQAMIRGDARNETVHEMYDVFMRADELFGNYYKSLTRSFSLYGPFDGVHDVLFHDSTDRLQGQIYMNQVERDIPNYDTVLKDVSTCVVSLGHSVLPSIILIVICIIGAFY